MNDYPVLSISVTRDQWHEMLEDLDAIRDSGKVNMFGAAPVLARLHRLSKSDARTVLAHWMDAYLLPVEE